MLVGVLLAALLTPLAGAQPRPLPAVPAESLETGVYPRLETWLGERVFACEAPAQCETVAAFATLPLPAPAPPTGDPPTGSSAASAAPDAVAVYRISDTRELPRSRSDTFYLVAFDGLRYGVARLERAVSEEACRQELSLTSLARPYPHTLWLELEGVSWFAAEGSCRAPDRLRRARFGYLLHLPPPATGDLSRVAPADPDAGSVRPLLLALPLFEQVTLIDRSGAGPERTPLPATELTVAFEADGLLRVTPRTETLTARQGAWVGSFALPGRPAPTP